MKEKREEPVMSIRLKGIGQTHVFHPGDTISGVVEVVPDTTISCRNVVVTVGWHTEGRGDRDGMAIHNEIISVTAIQPEAPLIHHFDVMLPPEPWSYVGTLIRIVWEVHAKVDIAFSKDINQTLQFILEPAPHE